MTNAAKFEQTFGLYATELWAKPEEEFLEWLNAEAELERKKGKWISDRLISTSGGTYGVRRCSECEAYYQDVGYGWNFCPHCGAKMEG